MQIDEEIGARVRHRRELLGLSKAELVRRLRGRGHLTLYPERQREIERGKRMIKPGELVDYCRELRCPLWWILGISHEESMAIDTVFLVEQQQPGG